ncbi:MAG: Ig-like domain-containing protein, partial [Akkermansiaceae bacterium]|nr:Ig-like domain-containing protein [Akkermansiaceae bacterium]
MPLGDSITRGSNRINYPNGAIPGGYRRELGARLAIAGIAHDFVGSRSDNAAAGMDPHHNGLDGIRTDQVLANINTWLAVNPNVVLMHLGTNDMLQHVPVGTAIGNLNTLILRITQNAPQRNLCVSTIIPIDETRDGKNAAEWGAIVSTYNSQLKSLVQSHISQGRNVSLIDMHSSLVYTNPNSSSNFFQVGDRTHPGQAGYNQMGTVWSKAFISGAPNPPPIAASLLVNGTFAADYSGWSHSGNQIVAPPSAYNAPSGSKLVAFNGGNSQPNGVLSQTFSTLAGSSYRITFHAGVIAWNTLQQRLGIDAGNMSQVLSLAGPGGGTARWSLHTYDFVANSNQTTLRFRDLSSSSQSLDLLLTNVTVTGQAGSGNTAPIANDDSYAINTGSSFSAGPPGVLGNDTDAQSNPLTAVLVANPSHGTLLLNGNGSFTYTPSTGFIGTDSFTYQARDALSASSPATVRISISSPSSDLLINSNFESGLSGWTTSGNVSPKNSSPYTASSGSGLVAFNDGNRPSGGSISQSFPTVAGRSYALAFDSGTYSFNTTSQTLHVSVRGNASLYEESTTLKGANGGSTRWITRTHSFIADRNVTTITFTDISSGTNGIDLLLDHIRLIESHSPAPAAFVTAPAPV